MEATPPVPTVVGSQRSLGRRFWWGLVAVVLLAAFAQLARVETRAGDIGYDGPLYHNASNLLADGEGFIGAEALYFSGARRQSAIHPPMNLLWLSLGSTAGWRTALLHQRWEVLLGVAAVAMTALAARVVAGDRAGLIAGVLAAVHPAVWSYPARVMAETPAQAATALLLFCTYRWWRRPSLVWAGAVGGAAGLATMSRSEGALLLPLLLVVMFRHEAVTGPRARHLLVAGTWWLVLVSPWVIFNMSRFEQPVTIATGVDWAMASANCDAAYSGPLEGYWYIGCRPFNDVQYEADGTPMDESTENLAMRQQAVDYVKAHPGDVPAVAVARARRALSLWSPLVLARQESQLESRQVWVLLAGTAMFFALSVPALIGAIAMRRAGWTVMPAVALLASAVGGAMLTHGTTRYRAGLELAVVLMAAVAIDGWLDSRAQRGAMRS